MTACYPPLMSESNDQARALTDSIERENANSLSKIRSMFVDPGFPIAPSENAENVIGPAEVTGPRELD